ncbi:SLOG family protein [Microbacterium sp.]|uniref:SLOG family protein n=1 Tax=Microbacterium sp. TaxID=51671 RepID=UPI00261B7BB8|nr:SLOG family protein [Microbacterium sp.]
MKLNRPERLAVVVTGDRHAQAVDWQGPIYNVLDALRATCQHAVLIHGDCDAPEGAEGIDRIAARIAASTGWQIIPVPAMWARDDRAAGPRRNRIMLKILAALQAQGYRAGVLAFHDDIENSKGTKDCVAQAELLGLSIAQYTREGRKR